MQLPGSTMSSEMWKTNKKVSKLIIFFSAKTVSVQTDKRLSRGTEYIHTYVLFILITFEFVTML